MKKWGLISLVVVFIILLLLSFLFDNQFLNFVISHRIPFLDKFMAMLNFGLSELAIFIFVTMLFVYKKSLRRYIPLLWGSMIVSTIITTLLKIIIARPRPSIVTLIVASSFSFPSGHAALAFSTVPLIQKVFKKIKWFLIALVILIAFSRIYIGVHYLSDIIAGALVGYFTGYFMLRFSKSLNLKPN